MNSFILMDGPRRNPNAANFRRSRRWRVMVASAESQPAAGSKVYEVGSFFKAVSLAGVMARDRRLSLKIEASPI